MRRTLLIEKEGRTTSLNLPRSARSIAETAVETCSKVILALCSRHGKSPCFSRRSFLKLFGPDYTVLVLPCVDGQEFLECAF